MPSDTKTLVWLKTATGNSADTSAPVTLRVKHASKLGVSRGGFSEPGGNISPITLSALTALKPSSIEIIGYRNPIEELVHATPRGDDRIISEEQMRHLVENVRSVSVIETSCSSEALIALLKHLKIVSSVEFEGMEYTEEEWNEISDVLQNLNLRCLSLGCGPGDKLVNTLNVNALVLAGQPGLNQDELTKSAEALSTVRVLAVQDVDLEGWGDSPADTLINLLIERFPRLQALLLDWNVVDAALAFDDDTKRIVNKLIVVANQLSLKALSILAYTPCAESKRAASEVVRALAEGGMANVSLASFATKNAPVEKPNFSVIVGGDDEPSTAMIKRFHTEGRCTAYTTSLACALVDGHYSHTPNATIVDFGGFDSGRVQREYEEGSDG